MNSRSSEKPLQPKGKAIAFRRYVRPLPLTVTVGVLAFCVWFVFGERGLWERHKLALRYDRQAEQIARLETEKAALETYHDQLAAGDEQALERAAREQNFAAPNETVFDIKVDTVTAAK